MPGPLEFAEVESRLRDISAAITGAQARLRDELLAGESTKATRAWIEQLEAEQAGCRTRRDQLIAEQDSAEATRIAEAGQLLATEVAARVGARLAALQPPPSPVGAQP